MVVGSGALAERARGQRTHSGGPDCFAIVDRLACRLERVALYAIHVFGTFPPLAASWRMTSLWSQTFIFDEPFVFPE